MSSKWFISQNDQVIGPLSTEDVQARLQASELAPNDLIWGRGMPAWRDLGWWGRELPGLKTETVVEGPPENWHYALAGKSHGPFLRARLIEELRALPALGEVMLWTKGMKEWAPLFEFHDILSDVGANKRQFPRSELNGKAVLKADGVTLIAPLLTISEGGMGVRLETGLVAGQAVTVEIQSSAFREPLHARADVRYAADGVVGLKFSNLNSESKAAIIQFVRANQTRFVLKAA